MSQEICRIRSRSVSVETSIAPTRHSGVVVRRKRTRLELEQLEVQHQEPEDDVRF